MQRRQFDLNNAANFEKHSVTISKRLVKLSWLKQSSSTRNMEAITFTTMLNSSTRKVAARVRERYLTGMPGCA